MHGRSDLATVVSNMHHIRCVRWRLPGRRRCLGRHSLNPPAQAQNKRSKCAYPFSLEHATLQLPYLIGRLHEVGQVQQNLPPKDRKVSDLKSPNFGSRCRVTPDTIGIYPSCDRSLCFYCSRSGSVSLLEPVPRPVPDARYLLARARGQF